MGRDNPKDIFDIFLIDKFYSYDYKEILKVAHAKSGFRNAGSKFYFFDWQYFWRS